MIRKLPDGRYRLYSRKPNPKTDVAAISGRSRAAQRREARARGAILQARLSAPCARRDLLTPRRRPAARLPLALAGLLALASLVAARLDAQTTYDVVLHGGRVLDPESGLDAVRNIGITGRRIAALSAAPLHGRVEVDATGLVVTPGFIDLHSHGQTPENYRYKAMDGVTTALELEVGASPIDKWYAAREGKSLDQLRRQLRPHSGADGRHERHRRRCFHATAR